MIDFNIEKIEAGAGVTLASTDYVEDQIVDYMKYRDDAKPERDAVDAAIIIAEAAGFKTPCLLQFSQLWSQQLPGVQKSFISLRRF